MPERKHRFHVLRIIPAVPDENALGVIFIYNVFSLALDAGILLLVEHGAVLEFIREGEGKLTRRVDITAQHIGKRRTGFASKIPSLHYRRHLVHPWHGHGIAGDVHENKLSACGCESLHKGILPIRKSIILTVATLAVLVVVLVQAAEHNHVIGIPGCCDSVGDHLLRRTVFRQVDFCGDAVLGLCGATGIAALEHYLSLRKTGFQALQGRNLIPGFQRRGPASDGKHLHGILSYNQNLFCVPHRENSAVVL